MQPFEPGPQILLGVVRDVKAADRQQLTDGPRQQQLALEALDDIHGRG